MSATSPQDVTGGGGGVASPAPESPPRNTAQEQFPAPSVSTEETASKKEEEGAGQTQRQEEDVSGQEAEEGEVEGELRHEQDGSEKDEGEEKEEAAAAAAAAAEDQQDTSASAPPLPDEVPPPLPNEVPPGDDDGWEPVWDANAQAYYFYNRLTGVSQWENPRVPDAAASASSAAGAVPHDDNGDDGDDGDEDGSIQEKRARVLGGYNPAIHGDYDPTAPYAQQYERQEEAAVAGMDPNQAYEAVGAFNRFTGRWQAASQNPEYHNDENKSKRQMYAFFDVDAAANSHDGRSLRAERSAKKLTKAELKMFKEKRREKKEEKRRAWLRD
ncbi:WW domain-containing protein [Aspergillus fijiensis CBS 313.89]|uniref:WW domain-containing protein n=1 Tax=Aspergillus fijiensis CBS 313.89 TaxID=1448319 RepID=A0A8G1RZ63_9EURO|nr:uncharacterized protein BO72DRAFT_444994 [Aspergillus fijiensis CBS 313.89]RAK80993.1 hypothetical protein BO72DRAFT_444994 [Aspergillus fijiensis CBS 313.89]